jgi:hypothetical protein
MHKKTYTNVWNGSFTRARLFSIHSCMENKLTIIINIAPLIINIVPINKILDQRKKFDAKKTISSLKK